MAGKTLQKIYCWRLTIEKLNVFLASTDNGARRIWLSLGKPEKPFDFIKKSFPHAVLTIDEKANSRLIESVRACLENSFVPTPPLDVAFTPFQKRVYNTISKIPFGETRQYKEIASKSGTPGGARAVGQAMKRNPFPLIFP
jgi:O6-methylguanine-DNA--protein-cysteine methyltransferase